MKCVVELVNMRNEVGNDVNNELMLMCKECVDGWYLLSRNHMVKKYGGL